MKKLTILILLLIFQLFYYCSLETPDVSCTAVDLTLPAVSIDCSKTGKATQCNDGSVDGKPVFIYWFSQSTDCYTFDATTMPYLARNKNTALTTCTATKCTGSVTSWLDSSGNTIKTITGGSLKACAIIDTDNDGLATKGEPVGLKIVTNSSCGSSLGKAITSFFDHN